VFLRTDGDHLGPLPELYASPEALRQGIERALARGLPMSRLLIVEYCAEPVLPRLYRKFSVFRVGKACVAHTCVDDTQWIAKFGQRGISPPEFFEQEFAIVRDNPYGAAVWDAFDVAGMEYGRADFGLVEGRPQVYEINSNPHVVLEDDNPNLARRRTSALFAANYGAALRTIDTPDSNTLVTIAAPALRKH